MELLDRVKIRLLPDEPADNLLNELLATAKDRVCLRLGAEQLPSLFHSIVVELTVKLYRRLYFEGIKSESADTLNTHFFEDLLAEYDPDFRRYLIQKEKEETEAKKGRLSFL